MILKTNLAVFFPSSRIISWVGPLLWWAGGNIYCKFGCFGLPYILLRIWRKKLRKYPKSVLRYSHFSWSMSILCVCFRCFAVFNTSDSSEARVFLWVYIFIYLFRFIITQLHWTGMNYKYCSSNNFGTSFFSFLQSDFAYLNLLSSMHTIRTEEWYAICIPLLGTAVDFMEVAANLVQIHSSFWAVELEREVKLNCLGTSTDFK